MTTYTSPQTGSTEDTWMASNAVNNNYYNDANIHVGESGGSVRRSLLRFPGLTTIENGAIAIVDSSSLFLKQNQEYANANASIYIYRSSRAWVVTQETWNIWKTSNNWATGGAMGAGDYDNNLVGSLALSSTEANGWKEIVLSAALIQEIVRGTYTEPSFLAKMSAETGDTLHVFDSTDSATQANRPYIVVEYHLPGGYPKILIL